MPVQEPLYWVNGIPIYANQNSFIVRGVDNTPDVVDVLGELKINSLVFENPTEAEIQAGDDAYVITTGGTSYITLTANNSVAGAGGDIDKFKVTFDTAAPPAKILLLLFSSASNNGAMKIEDGQLLDSGLGSILLKDNEDIVVDPALISPNDYNRASILFVSDGSNWIELSRFLYKV
jgi:hypothetical protein